MDTYRRERDVARDEIKLAEETNPMAYMAGDIAGGIAPALLTGGGTAVASAGRSALKAGTKTALGKAALKAGGVGAGYGAGVGLGRSEAELTEGEIGETIQDIGEGALGGAAGGAVLGAAVTKAGQSALKQVPEALSKAADKSRRYILDKSTPTIRRIAKAVKFGEAGDEVVGKEIGEVYAKQLQNETDDVIKLIKDSRNRAKNELNDFFHSDEVKPLMKDFQGKLNEESKVFQSLMEDPNPDVQKFAAKGLSLIQNQKSKLTMAKIIDEKGSKQAVGLANVKDLYDFQKQINKLVNDPKVIQNGEQAYKNLSRLTQEVGKEIEEILGKSDDKLYGKMKEILGTYAKTYKLSEGLTPTQKGLLKQGKMTPQVEERIKKKMFDIFLNKDSEIANPTKAVEAKELYKAFYKNFEELAGKDAAKNLDTKISKLSMLLDINPRAVSESLERSFKQAAIGSVGAVGIRAGVGVGILKRGIKTIANLPKNSIQKMADSISNPKHQKYKNLLTNISEASPQRKKALLFSASQDPEFREVIVDLIPFMPDGEDDE